MFYWILKAFASEKTRQFAEQYLKIVDLTIYVFNALFPQIVTQITDLFRDGNKQTFSLKPFELIQVETPRLKSSASAAAFTRV